jgi:thioredoxin-like negative regulator of GroEL
VAFAVLARLLSVRSLGGGADLRSTLLFLLCSIWTLGCERQPQAPEREQARALPIESSLARTSTAGLDQALSTGTTAAATPGADLVPLADRRSARVVKHGLAWYVDASAAALHDAKQNDKLLLVDLWAPWCHTCLSMREYVLTAAHLADVREQLVFLALDTERAENAAALSRWPVSSWPTLYLVDGDGNIQGRWVGAASPAQLSRFVRDGQRAAEAKRTGTLAADDPLALLIAGDRKTALGQLNEASTLYRQTLRAAPSDWLRRPETWVALAGALRKLDQPGECVDLGLDVLAKSERQLGLTASATDFVYLVLDCARSLAARSHDVEDARIKELSHAAERKLRVLCEQGGPALTPDDRSDACGLLCEQRKALGDQAGERRAAEQRLHVLEAAAQGVPDAVALTYDSARSETLLYLERAPEALALLQARERALPDDYNPPYYLARVYRDLGRTDDALAALERAIALSYGPRRAGMLTLKTDLLLAQNDKPGAKQALETQLAAYRALPEGQRQPAREAAVVKRLSEL